MWLFNHFPVSGITAKDRRSLKRFAQYENERQWIDMFSRLTSIVLNQFKWEGLPPTCDPYFFETSLLFRGDACFIEDKPERFLSLPCVPMSGMSIYYSHPIYRAISLHYNEPFMALDEHNIEMYEWMLKTAGSDESAPKRGVVCKDNLMGYSIIATIEIYTDKLVDAARTIDVVSKQLKIPSIIETTPETKVAVQTALQDINENTIAVYAGQKIAQQLRETKSIPVGVNPSMLTAAWDHFNNTLSAFYTAVGINNLNTADKKERLLTDEVNSNNDAIQQNLGYRLEMRKQFCRDMKAVFGLDISCDLRYRDAEAIASKGGVRDGRNNIDDAGSANAS